jgi:general secretion pathway protein D
MKNRAWIGLSLGLVLLTASAGWGQTADPNGSGELSTDPNDVEMIKLTFPTNMEVKTLVEYVSRRLKINILYDQAVGRQRVTISSPTEIPKSSLLGLLESVLKMSNLALIEGDQKGWKRIVAGQNLLDISSDIKSDPNALRRAANTKILSQVIRLKYVSPTSADRTIRPLMSKPGGNSFLIPNTDAMIVTDYADSLRRISAILKMIDRPGRKAEVKMIEVEHVEASSLAQQVLGLLQEKRQVSGVETKGLDLTLRAETRTNQLILVGPEGADAEVRELVKKLDVPSKAETRTYRFRYIAPQRVERLARELTATEASQRSYKSTIDPESGLLVVTAMPAVHKRVAALAEQLDVAETVEAERSRIRFYKLMNTTASHVLSTIRAIEGGEGDLQSISFDGEEAARKTTDKGKEPRKDSEERYTGPKYDPSKDVPSLPKTAAGPRTAVQSTRTKDAVITIDENTNTVIVVAAPEIQHVYERLIRKLDRRRPQVMVEVTLITLDTSDGYSLGVELSRTSDVGDDAQALTFSSFGLSSVDPVTGALSLVPGVGFNGAIIGSDTADVVLRALATDGRSKVLSAPKVLVNDNATASLSSVSEAPFTSINASETVSTTSFAGYASAGTTIAVTPHISEGDHLQMQYSITLNSFTGEGSSSVPPPRQTNTLSSEVTVPDGYAVITGGLTREDDSDSASKIPLLGDIPWLGHAFRQSNRSHSQSTLFVFIRPVILRDDLFEDLKYLSSRELKAAGLPDNLPASRPLLME